MIGRDSNSPNMYAHIHMTVKCVVETATLLNICSYSHLCQIIGGDGISINILLILTSLKIGRDGKFPNIYAYTHISLK